MLIRILPLTLLALVEGAPPAQSEWLSHQASIFAETVVAWFGLFPTRVEELSLALNAALRSDVSNERQASLVSNSLITLRENLEFYSSDWYALLNALDGRLIQQGVDIQPHLVTVHERNLLTVFRHVMTPNERRIMEKSHRYLPHPEDLETLTRYIERVSVEVREYSLALSVDFRSVYLPWLALVHWPENQGVVGPHKWTKLDSILSNQCSKDLAVARANLLLDPETYPLYSGLFNELLPAIALLRIGNELPDFLSQELDIVEGWLSNRFADMNECPRLISRALRDIQGLSSLGRVDQNVIEMRDRVFQRKLEEWKRICLVDHIDAPIRPVRNLNSLLEVYMAQLSTNKRLDSHKYGFTELATLTRTFGFSANPHSEQVRTVLEAVQLALQEVSGSLLHVQYDFVMTAVYKLIEDMEEQDNLFEGMVEGAYKLARFGIRLFKHTCIPGESVYRMTRIRRIVSYWLFGQVDRGIRDRMVNLIKRATDEELNQIASAWYAYVEAYNTFKSSATLLEAVSGFAPYAGILHVWKLEDLQNIGQYFNNSNRKDDEMLAILPERVYKAVVGTITEMSRNSDEMTTYPVRAGQIYLSHLLPLARLSMVSDYQVGSMVRFPSYLNQAVFRWLVFDRPVDEEVRTALRETIDAALDSVSRSDIIFGGWSWRKFATSLDQLTEFLHFSRRVDGKSEILSKCRTLQNLFRELQPITTQEPQN